MPTIPFNEVASHYSRRNNAPFNEMYSLRFRQSNRINPRGHKRKIAFGRKQFFGN